MFLKDSEDQGKHSQKRNVKHEKNCLNMEGYKNIRAKRR